MECAVCGIRSSVGYCAECQKLLCEECGIKCDHCAKMVCSDHVYETSSGKSLCPVCKKERDERRRKRRHHRDDEEAAGGSTLPPGVEEPEGEEEEEVILVESARQATPPWLLSVYASSAALVVALVVLFVPGFRGLSIYLTLVPAVLVALAGLAWAVFGMVSGRYMEDRNRCGIGLVLAVLALAGAAWAISSDVRARRAEEQEAVVGSRDYESPEGRKQWRQEQLRRGTRGSLPGQGE